MTPKSIRILCILAILAIMSACTPKIAPAPKTAPDTLPSKTATPTASPTPTSSAPPKAVTLAEFKHADVYDLALSHDGASFAVAGSAGLDIFDAATKAELRHYYFGDVALTVDFSPDDSLLVSYATMALRVVRVADGIRLLELSGFDEKGSDYRITHDNQTLVVRYDNCYSHDGCYSAIHVWNIATQKEMFAIDPPAVEDKLSAVRIQWLAMQMSKDEKTIFAAGSDGIIYAWSLTTGDLISKFTGHTGAVEDLAISPDGTVLASAGDDNIVRLWRLPGGEIFRTIDQLTLGSHKLTFSPDGESLKITDQDSQVEWRDVAGGQVVSSPTDLIDPLEPIEEYVRHAAGFQGTAPDIFLSPGGETALFFTGYPHDESRSSLQIWDVGTKTLQATIQTPALAVACDPSLHMIISVDVDGFIREWNPDTGEEEREIAYKPFDPTTQDLILALSPDNQTLAVNYAEAIDLVNLDTGEVMKTLLPAASTPIPFFSFPYFITSSMAFSSSGTKLNVIYNYPRNVQSWDVASGEIFFNLPLEEENYAAVYPDYYLVDGDPSKWEGYQMATWPKRSNHARNVQILTFPPSVRTDLSWW